MASSQCAAGTVCVHSRVFCHVFTLVEEGWAGSMSERLSFGNTLVILWCWLFCEAACMFGPAGAVVGVLSACCWTQHQYDKLQWPLFEDTA
jgi:hypothetical protein